jgi:hypothetical protein
VPGALPGLPPVPGGTPGLPPGVPKPAIPGYVTEEEMVALQQQYAVEQAAAKKAGMRNAGIALVVGWGIGYIIARKMKK